MNSQRLGHMCSLAAALGIAALAAGCSEDDAEVMIGQSTGDWTVFPMPFATQTPPSQDPNPITTIGGSAQLFSVGSTTRITLTVDKLPATRLFGAHVHKLSCAEMSAGPHYQHTETPDGGSRTDNMYANADNEIWLDFTTDATGKASVNHIAKFAIVREKAKAIIVHDKASSTAPGMGGVAGARLACLNLTVK